MTPTQAQAIQDDARVCGAWLMWFVCYERRTGKFIGRAHTASHDGGKWLPNVLVADTLAELRAMLPRGLTCRNRTVMMSLAVVETWD